MCGRFVRFTSWADLRQTMTLLSPSETAAEHPPSYNVAPTQKILVARQIDEKREGVIMRWGLIPSWAKDKKLAKINARADSASEKPMFRAAFKKRRCLILADSWYEWKTAGKQKQPFFFRLETDEPMLFAGLWETWDDEEGPVETCAIPFWSAEMIPPSGTSGTTRRIASSLLRLFFDGLPLRPDLLAHLASILRLHRLLLADFGWDLLPSTEQVLLAAAFRAGSLAGLLQIHWLSPVALWGDFSESEVDGRLFAIQ